MALLPINLSNVGSFFHSAYFATFQLWLCLWVLPLWRPLETPQKHQSWDWSILMTQNGLLEHLINKSCALKPGKLKKAVQIVKVGAASAVARFAPIWSSHFAGWVAWLSWKVPIQIGNETMSKNQPSHPSSINLMKQTKIANCLMMNFSRHCGGEPPGTAVCSIADPLRYTCEYGRRLVRCYGLDDAVHMTVGWCGCWCFCRRWYCSRS